MVKVVDDPKVVPGKEVEPTENSVEQDFNPEQVDPYFADKSFGAAEEASEGEAGAAVENFNTILEEYQAHGASRFRFSERFAQGLQRLIDADQVAENSELVSRLEEFLAENSPVAQNAAIVRFWTAAKAFDAEHFGKVEDLLFHENSHQDERIAAIEYFNSLNNHDALQVLSRWCPIETYPNVKNILIRGSAAA